MRRRSFLTGTAAATALAVAGCLQEPGDRGDGSSPETTDDGAGPGSQPEGTGEAGTPTDESGTATDEPEPTAVEGSSGQAWGSGGRMNGVDFSFSSQSPETGEDRDEADITRDDEMGAVRVDGTISGSDSCKRAKLGSLDYDEAAGTLAVGVETTEIENCEAGAQALVGIDYEGTFEVDGDLPSEVTVSHDGQEIAGASYASDSASATESGTGDAT
ncbi:twin-arginine translocation signal domain-containing protein [Halorientalis halophila]|uniref:twin-arginine translocation signal domain-containing protein n=1 Tax=Halorientalis halophila TaxID=3108499 RepID=UPI0030093DCF